MKSRTQKSNFKKFDGTDFVLWKDKVQAALKASKCVEAIKTEFKIKIEGEDENKAEKEKAYKEIYGPDAEMPVPREKPAVREPADPNNPDYENLKEDYT